MPYKKYRRNKLRKYNNKRFQSMSAIMLARKNARKIKSIQSGIEWKHYDSDASNSGLTITGVGILFSGVDAGSAQGQRSGNSTIQRSLQMNILFSRNASASGATTIRLALIHWHPSTVPAKAEIFKDPTDTLTYFNLDFTNDFTILRNQVITLTDQFPSQLIKFNEKFRIEASYSGNTASDIESGKIYLYLFSDEGTNTPGYKYYQRMKYTDQ